MKNVEFLSNTYSTGIEEIAVIYNEDGSYTSIPKAVYEAQQMEHLTEILPTE